MTEEIKFAAAVYLVRNGVRDKVALFNVTSLRDGARWIEDNQYLLNAGSSFVLDKPMKLDWQ